MSLERIIDLQISRETAAVSQAGFGAGNFLSFNALFQERIKQYSSYSAVAADPLAGADALAFAESYFGQVNKPSTLYVTRKGKDVPRILTLDFSADFVTDNTINLKVNTTPIAEVTYATSHSATLTALAVALETLGTVATATVTGARQITITAANNGVALNVTEIVVAGGASQATGTTTVTQYEDELLTDVESLDAAVLENNDWYALASYNRNDIAPLLIAAWVQTQRKIYILSYSAANIVTSATDDLGSDLKNGAYDRTALIYSEDMDAWPEGAWMGRNLPLNPGSITWMFKSLSGVQADALTDTEIGYALGKNVNIYSVVGGQPITREGKMASGEYIDVIRGIDWVHARMTENVYQAFITEPKIPYTDDGVSIIVNRIQQILDQAVVRSVFTADPRPTIIAPLVANVPVNDRANRTLPDVTWEAVLAGAIHKTIIRGTVTV